MTTLDDEPITLNGETFEPVHWTYLGQRLVTGGKIGHCWLDHQGQQRLYSSIKGKAVGAVYRLNIREDGDTISRTGDPEYTGTQHPDLAQIAIWQALDRATKDRKNAESAERRFAERQIDLGDLETVAAKCRSLAEVDALVAVTRQRIYKAWSK